VIVDRPPSLRAWLAHNPAGIEALVAAEPTVCALDGESLATHPRCRWCTVLLGPNHVEDVPQGYAPGDTRAMECDFCWYGRQRRAG
jgi:hypothetical protein